jgi:hypothetical protein
MEIQDLHQQEEIPGLLQPKIMVAAAVLAVVVQMV